MVVICYYMAPVRKAEVVQDKADDGGDGASDDSLVGEHSPFVRATRPLR